MNRRQFLPLFGLPAVGFLPKPTKALGNYEYVLGWQEIAIPNTTEVWPNGWGTFQLDRALAEIEKLRAEVILIENRDFHHYIQAELVCSDFCVADRLKRSWISTEENFLPLPHRTLTNAAITHSPNYQPPKDHWAVRWDEESGFSWWDNWPERRYDMTFQKSIGDRAHIVQVREACDALTVWTFEEYFTNYEHAQQRYLCFERSGQYCRDSLSLFRT